MPIADRDEFDLTCLVQRDQVLEVNLPHAANTKRAKSQPVAMHVKDSIGRNRSRLRQAGRGQALGAGERIVPALSSHTHATGLHRRRMLPLRAVSQNVSSWSGGPKED